MYMPNRVQNIFFSARADSSSTSSPATSGACRSSVPRRSSTVCMVASSSQRMDDRVQRPDQAEADGGAGKQRQHQRKRVAIKGIAEQGDRIHGASPSTRDWVQGDAPPKAPFAADANVSDRW